MKALILSLLNARRPLPFLAVMATLVGATMVTVMMSPHRPQQLLLLHPLQAASQMLLPLPPQMTPP